MAVGFDESDGFALHHRSAVVELFSSLKTRENSAGN